MRPLIATGKFFSVKELADQHGIGNGTFWTGINAELARNEALAQVGPIDPAALGKTVSEKYAALERRLMGQFENAVQEEVRRRVNEHVLPYYKERLANADKLSQYGKPFTNEQYRQVLAALHPDSQPERRAKAFALVKDKEILLRPEDRPQPYTGDLPQTIEELMARRRTKR